MEGRRSVLRVDVVGTGTMLGVASHEVGLQAQWLSVELDTGRSLIAAGVPPVFRPSQSSASALRGANLHQKGNPGNAKQNPRSMRTERICEQCLLSPQIKRKMKGM